MADVFISYSQGDREWVKGLATALEAEGLSVWWDPNLLPGARFREIIKQQLAEAKAAIVVWSHLSVDSDWVLGEADEARTARKLVPILREPVKPPTEFRSLHTADLSQWRGRTEHPGFRQLVAAIRALVGPPASEATPPFVPVPAARIEPPRKTGRYVAATAAAVFVLAGAIWTGYRYLPSGHPAAPAVTQAPSCDNILISQNTNGQFRASCETEDVDLANAQQLGQFASRHKTSSFTVTGDPDTRFEDVAVAMNALNAGAVSNLALATTLRADLFPYKKGDTILLSPVAAKSCAGSITNSGQDNLGVDFDGSYAWNGTENSIGSLLNNLRGSSRPLQINPDRLAKYSSVVRVMKLAQLYDRGDITVCYSLP